MAIDLWAARLERLLTPREEEAMRAMLPPQRRERLDRLPREKQREPLCAYLILRLALWEKHRWKELPELALTDMGKPYFPDYPGVQFNISHTTGAVLVGLGDQPLGVDIEKIRPVSQRSMQRLAGVGTEKEFFQSWVRREARSKRGGVSVGTMMRSETPLQYGEFYYELETFSGYAAGLATRDKTPPGKVRKYTLDEMI